MKTKQGNIVWLASYPKSGNTWFRVFLTNLFSELDEPADINKIIGSTIASSISLFEDATGINASDLSQEEIDLLRPQVYQHISDISNNELHFHKIHDAWRIIQNSKPLIPLSATKAVIYFIRNPLDVSISFAHHSSCKIEKAINNMNDSNFAFCDKSDRFYNQLRQVLFSWSKHVNSWVKESGLPVIVLRYEDMLESPFETFGKAVNFVGLNSSKEKIIKAIENSSFNTLKQQEMENGFKEKSPASDSFFRKGIKDDWKQTLTKSQIDVIVKNHHEIMREYSYLH